MLMILKKKKKKIFSGSRVLRGSVSSTVSSSFEAMI